MPDFAAMATCVLTRDGAAPYATALEALGLDVVMVPVTQTAPPPDPGALVRALERGGFAAIVCASRNAAGALVRSKGHAAIPEVWVVGPATARVLEEAGITPILPDDVKDGAALARALVAQRELAGKQVLVPRAEDGRDEGIQILREAGAIVVDICAYRTVPLEVADPTVFATAEVVVVFAPSQVAGVDRAVGVSKLSCVWAAIGETTAAALRAAGAAVVGVAETPTPEGIANAVAAVYPRKR